MKRDNIVEIRFNNEEIERVEILRKNLGYNNRQETIRAALIMIFNDKFPAYTQTSKAVEKAELDPKKGDKRMARQVTDTEYCRYLGGFIVDENGEKKCQFTKGGFYTLNVPLYKIKGKTKEDILNTMGGEFDVIQYDKTGEMINPPKEAAPYDKDGKMVRPLLLEPKIDVLADFKERAAKKLEELNNNSVQDLSNPS